MAIYHLSVKPVSRGEGRSATAAAAYRAAERVHDHTTGQSFDYTRKQGVEHSEIVLPISAVKRDINWARDREALWNAAERAENRSNSRVAREYELALPHELNRRQRVELVRDFSQDIANRYCVAVDFSLHAPHRQGDERNYHAHVLTTTRTVEATRLGDKTTIEWSDTNRAKAGMGPAKQEITEIRERWAALTNEKLLQLGRVQRVDHRTLEAQGIDREPTKHLGPAIAGILEREEPSTVVHRWQQEADERLRLAKELGQLERERRQVREKVPDLSNDLAAAIWERDLLKLRRLTPEQMRAKGREQWLEMRNMHNEAKGQDQSHGLEADEEKERGQMKDHGHSRAGPDDDFRG